MKKLLLLLHIILVNISYAQITHNEYGEVKTSIQWSSSIQSWTNYDLDPEKNVLISKLGEAMFDEIYNHSNFNQWPYALNETNRFFANSDKMVNYNVWLIASTNRCGILRVAYKDNGHMPGGFLPSDGKDFYLVVFDNAITNYGVCKANLKNSPEVYNKLFGNKTILEQSNTLPQAGIEEYNNGIKAYKETDHGLAIEWYKRAAERGNVDAMFNLGNMYFKNNLPYNSSDITYDLTHNDNVTHRRYVESYKWYKAAADLGNGKGMYSLGVAYLEGYGVNIDVKEARKWFQKSLDHGCLEAKTALEIMDKNY